MVCYYDSSFLLAGILGQQPPATLATFWDPVTVRLSSTVLKIECFLGLLRAAALQRLPPDGPWLGQRVSLLRNYTEALDCRQVDDEIEAIIRGTPALSGCRTLDAIHIATALYFQPHLEEPLRIVTLDKRLREVARRLGFSVLPARERLSS
jgi:predicted nucleic acid-binding protein